MVEIFQPRSVFTVLMEILLIIPESEKLIIEGLNKFKTDLDYKAPELLVGGDCWLDFIQLLNHLIPNISEDWQIKIKNVLSNNY